MPKYQKFEDLPVWHEAARLYNQVLDLLEEPGVPLTAGFRNQLDRAALSVSNNIAEGFERVTTNELLSFLAHRARFLGRSPIDDRRGNGTSEAQAAGCSVAENSAIGGVVCKTAHGLDEFDR